MGNATGIDALIDFGCHDRICDVMRELTPGTAIAVTGRAQAYRCVLPAMGTPSGMHAHADRLYLLLDPNDAGLLADRHAANVMKHNPTTWYVSWSATQLEDPGVRAVVVAAAERALSRAGLRALNAGAGGGGGMARLTETCSACWTVVTPSGNCNCD